MLGNGPVRFGGRPSGKGPVQQGPRRSADPTRTLLDEWAYLRPYTSNDERTEALADFLHTYNHHRCHTALGGHPPISRVNNAAGQYT
jgi:transposase InsO family protein